MAVVNVFRRIANIDNPTTVIKTVLPAAGAALSVGGQAQRLAESFVAEKIAGNPSATIDKVSAIIKEMSPGDVNNLQHLDKDFQQLMLDHNLSVYELNIANVESARKLYAKSQKMADALAQFTIFISLPLIIVLVIIAGIMRYMGVNDPIVYTLIGGVLAQLYAERTTILQFFYGSSLNYKETKDV